VKPPGNNDEQTITNKEVINLHNFKRGYDLNHNSVDNLEGKNYSVLQYREMTDKNKKNIVNENIYDSKINKKEKENENDNMLT
jgi:hypothetical protein